MEQEKINRLQWILDDAVARGEIPGAILMVRKEGKETVYLESGYADIEAKKPVSRDSIYRLYSMSKPITATAVMILVERGMLDLNMPVLWTNGGSSRRPCGKAMAGCHDPGSGEYDLRSGL